MSEKRRRRKIDAKLYRLIRDYQLNLVAPSTNGNFWAAYIGFDGDITRSRSLDIVVQTTCDRAKEAK